MILLMGSDFEISITRKDNIIEINGTGISVNFHTKDKERTLNGILEKCRELDLLLPDDKYFKDVKHDLEIQLTYIYEEYQKGKQTQEDKKDTENNNSEEEEVIAKRQYPSFKYSNKGKENLHEAVILSGVPVYLIYENGECKVFAQIEESSRIIKPPHTEEYPYEPYEFANMPELLSYLKRAKEETNLFYF